MVRINSPDNMIRRISILVFIKKCVIIFDRMTYMYFDKTGSSELLFTYELEHPTETKHDANKAFEARYGYDPVTARHIEIKSVEPQLAEADW